MQRFLVAVLVLSGFFLPGPTSAFTLSPFPLPLVDGQELPLILAQSTGGTGGSTGGSSGCGQSACSGYEDSDPALPPPPPGVPADAIGISPKATKQIVAMVDESIRYCRDTYLPEYRIDCLARAYVRIGKTLPYRSGYGGVRNALIQAGTQLHDLAIANTAPNKPAKVGRTSRRSPPERLRPVIQTPEVTLKASGIIEGTQLVLLRASTGSEAREAAYKDVARVVGSSVVLLRAGRRKRRRDETPGLTALERLVTGLRPGSRPDPA